MPYGTGTAFNILKSVIDPGLDGDLYADRPHLYGCALSSFNIIRVGETIEDGQSLKGPDQAEPKVIEEGGDGEGLDWRKEKGVPDTASSRKKWFLKKGHPESWEWEAGRIYECDFFNPYLDFNGTSTIHLLA